MVKINGPGRLTKALGITRTLNRKKATRLPVQAGVSGLWIEARNEKLPYKVIRTPWIGVAYAGEWAKKPLQYILKS